MLNSFGEGYLSLLERFLFLSIRRLYFMKVLRQISMGKVLQELFWAHFFGCPYRSNGTKIHLDAALTRNRGISSKLGAKTRYLLETE